MGILPQSKNFDGENYALIHEPLYPPTQPFSASLLREGNFSLLRAMICMMFFAKIILNLWLPHLNKKVKWWLRPKCLEDFKDARIKACLHTEGSSQKGFTLHYFLCSWMIQIWMPKHEASLTWIPCDVTSEAFSKPSRFAGFGGSSWFPPFWGLLRPY